MSSQEPIYSACPYCGTGCGVVVTKESDGGVRVKGDKAHPANFGRLCSKGAALGETLDLNGRLLFPQINGERVSWDKALDAVAQAFRQSIDEHGPDSVAFYVSGQLLTEDYYAANKLMKGFIGSANIDTNSRLCMASSVAGHKRAFGSDTVPNNYDDLELADLVVITGSNLAWCHPVLYQRIIAAKQQRPEMKVVVIDPRRTATCDGADLHLAIKPGTDVWLFNGLLDFLRRNDRFDYDYIDAHTEGFGQALRVARESAGSIPSVAAACDLPEEQVAQFFSLFARTQKTLTIYSQGVNQSSAGTDKVNSIINCHLATGRIGKPGCGPFSVTGQPNAMGGREVGALANQLVAHMDFAPEHLALVKDFWKAPVISQRPGLKAVDLFQAVEAGKIKVLWIIATNPLVSLPDGNAVRRALEKCPTVIVSDNVDNNDTIKYAHIRLPALAWGEKSGTVTNSERRISRQRTFLPAPGEAKADWWICSEVAKRLGFAEQFPYQSPADIFREYAQLSGHQNGGSRDFDISALAEISNAAYDALMPVQWPYAKDVKDKPSRFFAEGGFFTPNAKARFITTAPRAPQSKRLDANQLVLNTGRVRDQWHTMTRTGKTPKLLAHIGEPLLSMHPQDAARLGIRDQQLVEVKNDIGQLILRAQFDDGLRQGEVFAPMHWNRQFSATANVGEVIQPFTDPVSGQPEFKYTPVRVLPYQPAWQGFIMSRNEIDLSGLAEFRNEIMSQGYWRYELAGGELPSDWKQQLETVFGEGEWLEYIDRATLQYRYALLTDGQLQACAFIAATELLPPRDGLRPLFAKEQLNSAERLSLLTGKVLSNAPATGPTICSCYSVGRETLLRAIREQGLSSVEEIGAALKAGTNCGSCVPELKTLLVEAKTPSQQAMSA